MGALAGVLEAAAYREHRFTGERVSARELARRLNRPRSRLSDIVAGRRLPDYATLDDLIRVLKIDPAEAIDAWLKDQAEQSGRTPHEVSAGTRHASARLLQSRHHDMRIERLSQSGIADWDGSVDFRMRYIGCHPRPQADLNRLRLWVRAPSSTPGSRPSITVTAPPKLKWHVENAEPTENRYSVEFPDGWSHGTVDVDLETNLTGAYRVDPAALQEAAAGSPTGEAPGSFKYTLSMFVDALELSFRFPAPLRPARWWATAGQIGCRLDDDSPSVLEDVAESAELFVAPDGSSARLLLLKPLSGYRFGLSWSVDPTVDIDGLRQRYQGVNGE